MDTNTGDALVAVLPVDNNKILLIKNREEIKEIPGKEPFKKESKWGMPRGRKEFKDKDYIDTARREGREETGYEMEIDERYIVEEVSNGYTAVAFIGYPVAGRLDPDQKEIADARWLPPRVLWAKVGDENYFDMHPRQRRMAQELLRMLVREGKESKQWA